MDLPDQINFVYLFQVNRWFAIVMSKSPPSCRASTLRSTQTATRSKSGLCSKNFSGFSTIWDISKCIQWHQVLFQIGLYIILKRVYVAKLFNHWANIQNRSYIVLIKKITISNLISQSYIIFPPLYFIAKISQKINCVSFLRITLTIYLLKHYHATLSVIVYTVFPKTSVYFEKPDNLLNT